MIKAAPNGAAFTNIMFFNYCLMKRAIRLFDSMK